jgi:hypothetical protein
MTAKPPAPADDDKPQWGPAMATLNDRQRAFVMALFDPLAPAHGDGLLEYAIRRAKYGTGSSTSETLSAIAGRLITQGRIKNAITEYSAGGNRSMNGCSFDMTASIEHRSDSDIQLRKMLNAAR